MRWLLLVFLGLFTLVAGVGVLAMGLPAPVASVQTSTNEPTTSTVATPGSTGGPHCVSFMEQDSVPLSSEMQHKVEAFATETGKPVSVEHVGEHVCFTTTEALREYERTRRIQDGSGR